MLFTEARNVSSETKIWSDIGNKARLQPKKKFLEWLIQRVTGVKNLVERSEVNFSGVSKVKRRSKKGTIMSKVGVKK